MAEIYEDSLYGQVIARDWDNEFVSGVSILVDGEEECIVESDNNGKKLFDYVDHWVTVDGFVRETSRDLRIKVRSFTLEDGMDYIDYDNW